MPCTVAIALPWVGSRWVGKDRTGQDRTGQGRVIDGKHSRCRLCTEYLCSAAAADAAPVTGDAPAVAVAVAAVTVPVTVGAVTVTNMPHGMLLLLNGGWWMVDVLLPF